MDKIIFLDIDGVLNCNDTFKETKGYRDAFNSVMKDITDPSLYDKLRFRLKLLELDSNKINLLKEIVDLTGAKVVVSSSWRKLATYPLVEEYLINLGIPIIGVTPSLTKIGKEIEFYINNNNVEEYIIIEDSLSPDFNEVQKSNLVRTNFYQDGLNEECILEATLKLGLKSK